MSTHAPNQARVVPLCPATAHPAPAAKEPLWRDVIGDVLRRERRAQERTLKDVADAGRISMPYLSEVERGRKEASSEVLAAAAQALGLGLADLLALAQEELARLGGARAARPPRTAAAPVAPARSLRTSRSAPTARYGAAPSVSRQGEVRLAA
ncbi:helix-turn-helix domain-containing protein [Streptomyces albireticuli]|uniref:Transcriptional regulator n=1 Tax=Streptomyces albireticuli TaxID=1940 RepID=A0A2A2D776_9ACTN|nr:helix-turn-helix transcriptional regulator [Streptomyces albireticuli]MCD9142706.1 helix-turn-helix domain-containing protein [Streptomyces albireticuli]MCD9162975.1 helix-turn-helix domain-containing protein [Streptomyces albireticuli]MCD9192834.1 helix-turn-helix domain-containing protein [Streptomyces albireticuli]PAU47364.1 transcriptional regulator [Streptomyces albireticuli]